MKLNKIILIAVIAVLFISISTMLFAARAVKKVEKQAAMPALSGELLMSCYQASDLTLSQKDLANLEIVSSALTDPYCCKINFVSEERLDCLAKNSATLQHIHVMLKKIYIDIQGKCHHAGVYPPYPMLCGDDLVGSLSDKIHIQSACVKNIISHIGNEYEKLTQCPNN